MNSNAYLPFLLLLCGSGPGLQDPDTRAQPPPVRVSVLEVRAVTVEDFPTRRPSFAFDFEVLRTIEDGAQVTGERGFVREGRIRFRCFGGADVQAGKDSAARTLEILDAKPEDPPSDLSRSRRYAIGHSGTLRLTILRRNPTPGDLWILEREDGRRATIAHGRNW